MFAYVHSTAVTCHTLFMTGGLFKAGVISPNLLCGPPHPVSPVTCHTEAEMEWVGGGKEGET